MILFCYSPAALLVAFSRAKSTLLQLAMLQTPKCTVLAQPVALHVDLNADQSSLLCRSHCLALAPFLPLLPSCPWLLHTAAASLAPQHIGRQNDTRDLICNNASDSTTVSVLWRSETAGFVSRPFHHKPVGTLVVSSTGTVPFALSTSAYLAATNMQRSTPSLIEGE